ncbi:protein of unknown function [Methylacidimicrobium sp. AP8]|nr:protein of unknown function [Methylacidimicrobium sp. AP8]
MTMPRRKETSLWSGVVGTYGPAGKGPLRFRRPKIRSTEEGSLADKSRIRDPFSTCRFMA